MLLAKTSTFSNEAKDLNRVLEIAACQQKVLDTNMEAPERQSRDNEHLSLSHAIHQQEKQAGVVGGKVRLGTGLSREHRARLGHAAGLQLKLPSSTIEKPTGVNATA